MELPVPAEAPPQLPVYQTQVAPVPSEPPTTDRVVLCPKQIAEFPEIEVGAVEITSTVIVAQLVVTLQPLKGVVTTH